MLRDLPVIRRVAVFPQEVFFFQVCACGRGVGLIVSVLIAMSATISSACAVSTALAPDGPHTKGFSDRRKALVG